MPAPLSRGDLLLAGHLSDLCFAPTTVARDALLAEGITPPAEHVTGNTVINYGAFSMTPEGTNLPLPP